MSLPENSGYLADNLLELPSVAESGADLQSPGLKWYGTDLFHEGEINQNRSWEKFEKYLQDVTVEWQRRHRSI